MAVPIPEDLFNRLRARWREAFLFGGIHTMACFDGRPGLHLLQLLQVPCAFVLWWAAWPIAGDGP